MSCGTNDGILTQFVVHKPTFSPDKTPNLLLIAIIAIGASCLDKEHGHQVTQAGAELSNFLAWLVLPCELS